MNSFIECFKHPEIFKIVMSMLTDIPDSKQMADGVTLTLVLTIPSVLSKLSKRMSTH